MTQIVLSVSDNSLVPGLRKVLGRIGGVDKVQIIKESTKKPTNRERFLNEFSNAVSHLKDFKEGKMDYCSWEEMMNEL